MQYDSKKKEIYASAEAGRRYTGDIEGIPFVRATMTQLLLRFHPQLLELDEPWFEALFRAE